MSTTDPLGATALPTGTSAPDPSAAAADLPPSWHAFLSGQTRLPVPDAILASWQRSRAHGVDPHEPRFRRVPEAELRQRLRDNALLVELTRPHLEWIARAVEHPHVVYLTDRDGVVLLSSATSPDELERYGLSPGYDWSERQMGSNGAGTALATGRPVAVVGCAHYCRVWHSSTCLGAPVVLPDGEVVGALDLSASEDQAVPGELKLIAHAAWALGRELAARRAVEARDAVLASVSHELRNTLGSAHNAALLLARAPVAAEPRWSGALQILSRSTDLMRRLVDDLLDATAIESGRFEIEQAACDIAAVVEQACESVRALAEDRRVILEARRADGVACARCDAARIVQVLVNVLRNAVEHSPAEGRVTLEVEPIGDAVRFTVRDQGPGLAAGEEALFERPPSKGHRGRLGMGIGLRISRGIVEAHGGRLEMRSTAGGAEVSITIPA